MSRYDQLIGQIEAILAESKVVAFGKKPLKHIKIDGRRYFVTDYTPVLVRGSSGPIPDEDKGARVIELGKKPLFLWVHNEDRDTVTAWRVFDGDEKTHESANSMRHHLRALEKLGALNRVSQREQVAVERDMGKRYNAALKSLSQWIEREKKDIEKQFDGILYDRVKKLVVPAFKLALKDIESGVTPLGFKPFGGATAGDKMWVRQAATFALGKIWKQHMSYDLVAAWAKKQGIDLKNMDPQDSNFAIDDLYYNTADRILPKR